MNLLFQGDLGLGKTFLSACVTREVSLLGFSVAYETAVATHLLNAIEARRADL